jgi:tetratricopeptide (TPR) repeat protein
MDVEKNEKKTFSQKLSALLLKYRIIILSLVGLLIIAAVGLGVFSTVKSSIDKKNFAFLDELTFSLDQTKANLTEEMLHAKYDSIKEKIVEFTTKTKTGAPASRAFMILASIEFDRKNYTESKDAWISAYESNKNAYTAPVSLYNAAVCFEEIGEMENALEYYRLAVESKNFSLKPHALFNMGRLYSESGKYEDAQKMFQSIIDKFPNDNWADLAKSNLISLSAEGLIQ